ncbi:thioredoxin reductase 1, cytoplasmic-like [Amphibalanus amphitrite]|uniref:thioredoxin reductase 1, cytoplasmic-like n=1 Tax=Amphibalanus amphitrite TaxID=1232801 RepID=UPI001C8FD271|nr:thioredoxin reductase 1, cytoplasmic-like [Amphibalanus amphitrite]
MAPTPGSGAAAQVDTFIKENKVAVFSKSWCPFCDKVKQLFKTNGIAYGALELDQVEDGPALQDALKERTGQSTVPNVFVNGEHVGGCDDTLQAHSSGKLASLLNGGGGDAQYDYDVVVVGGGSGGLACSKEAAVQGARVAVCDFVKPSPQGTTWGLGGTCVNVGCIPKKLMHQAALLGEAAEDAQKFGWSINTPTHDWEKLVTAVQSHIGSLNWGYRVQLREKRVTYLNAYAQFVDEHTLKTVDKKGKEKTITSRYIVLATGGRPRLPDIPGAREYGISSDDIFSLPHSPGKTLIVGASYIALECAGFLRGLGLDVTVMVRSILLRGFDQQMANLVGEHLEKRGVKFIRQCVPTELQLIEEGPPRQVKVLAKTTDGEVVEGEYNTVLFAIGRDACTDNIGLDKVGVQLSPKDGKVVCTPDEKSTVSNIYAIGDVVSGKPELTPVAIQAGRLLARRLVNDASILTDYANVATTVFTPMEYGCIGLSEEDAIAQFGEDDIEVYHQYFTALEHTVAQRDENGCYAKLICCISQEYKVVGFHIVAPNAGEITQGYAVAMKLGARKWDFDATIGIHPTVSENFTTMNVTKKSGAESKSSGC